MKKDCVVGKVSNEFQKIKKSNELLSVNCIYGIADLVSSRCIMTFKIYLTIGKLKKNIATNHA